MSNAEALEREGVDMKQFFAEAGKRLAGIPAALEMYHQRMAVRDEEAYRTNPTVTLKTMRDFWASRLPYNEANGIPSAFPDFVVRLLDDAGGAPAGIHAEADLSRLQELVRYGLPAQQPAAHGAALERSDEGAPAEPADCGR